MARSLNLYWALLDQLVVNELVDDVRRTTIVLDGNHRVAVVGSYVGKWILLLLLRQMNLSNCPRKSCDELALWCQEILLQIVRSPSKYV